MTNPPPDLAALDAETLEQRLRHGAYLTWDELVALATAAADALAATRQVLQPPDVAALDAEIERWDHVATLEQTMRRSEIGAWVKHEDFVAYQAATRAALDAEKLAHRNLQIQYGRAVENSEAALQRLEQENNRLQEMERQLWWPKLLLQRAEAAEAALQQVEQERDALREQAQLYIDQREMTLAAKREAEAHLAQVEAALKEIAEMDPHYAESQDIIARAEARLREVTR